MNDFLLMKDSSEGDKGKEAMSSLFCASVETME